MKILHFTQLKNYNGTCSFFIDITKELISNNIEVIAIINKKANSLKEKLLAEKNNNLKIITFSNNRIIAIFQYIAIVFKNRKNSIALLHDAQRFPLLITKFFGVKNYTSIFGIGEKKIHKFAKLMDNILVAKKYQKEVIAEKYPDKNIIYFPYTLSIDDKNFSIPGKKDIFTFGCLGLFYKIKGFKELIEACEILKNKGYKFQLLLGGDGEEKDKLKELVKQKNLENYCIFLGIVTNKEEFYRKLNIFCFTSYKEDIGFIIPEAVGYSVPIIGNRIGFTSDALTENEYLIAEAENIDNFEEKWPKSKYTRVWWEVETDYRFETKPLKPELLAERMEFALNNYDIMLSKARNAYEKINNEYNLKKMVLSILR